MPTGHPTPFTPSPRTARPVGFVVAIVSAVTLFVAPMGAFAASGWAIQPTSNPSGATQAYLNGISCTSATSCTAVGYFLGSSRKNVTLAEAWNGTKWVVQPTPNPSGAMGAFLNAVSCRSATACIAVGYYGNSSGNNVTLAEAWNGTKWVIQPTPNPTATSHPVLAGVSCTSATKCTAVGHYTGTSAFVTLAEAWNGTKWVIQPTPNPTAASVSEFTGVSCTSAAVCTAVGFSLDSSNNNVALVEAWNGTKWVIQKTPTPLGATGTVLRGISCKSKTACTAVGDYLGSSVFLTLAEAWNGTKWVIQKTPNPSVTTIGSILTSVSCTSPSACAVVGYDFGGSASEVTLAEAWNGTKWVIQPTPNPTGAQQTLLNSVSCAAGTACRAVGYANVGSSTRALAEARP
jgi:hypothetical protein